MFLYNRIVFLMTSLRMDIEIVGLVVSYLDLKTYVHKVLLQDQKNDPSRSASDYLIMYIHDRLFEQFLDLFQGLFQELVQHDFVDSILNGLFVRLLRIRRKCYRTPIMCIHYKFG